jgi:hypothetical protein
MKKRTEKEKYVPHPYTKRKNCHVHAESIKFFIIFFFLLSFFIEMIIKILLFSFFFSLDNWKMNFGLIKLIHIFRVEYYGDYNYYEYIGGLQ